MWNANATFSENYNYSGNASAAADTSGQAGNKVLASLIVLALLAIFYILFANNTTAPADVPLKKEVPAVEGTNTGPKKQVEQAEKKVVAKQQTAKAALIESPAPAKPSELTYDDVVKFVQSWKHIAQSEQRRCGIPASISLAQAIIESRCGTSKLATQNNNYFGIKCFSRNCKDGHCTNRKDDHHKDFFRKFALRADSWTAHSNFLCQKRYKPLHGKTWRGWCYGLQQKGYATSKTYGKDLESIINRYKLYEYDKRY